MSVLSVKNGCWIKDGVLIKYNGDDKNVVIPCDVVKIKQQAFFQCLCVSKVVIADTVTIIGRLAFYGCDYLTNVSIADSVLNIEKDAFSNCKRLCFVRAPQSYALKSSMWFKNIFDEEVLPIIALSNFDKRAVLTKYILKDKVFCVKALSSRNRADLLYKLLEYSSKISLDELNRMIQVASEERNVEIYSMLLEYKNKIYSTEDIEKIEQNKLKKALGIKKYTVEDWKKVFKFRTNGGIVTITEYIGKEEHVYIPETIGKSLVESIGDNAFRGCDFVKSVTFPETLLKIGKSAFRDCVSLKKIISSIGVENIGCNAFFRCVSLESISIPKVKTLSREAFSECKSLSEIIILNDNVNIGWGVFSGCDNIVIKGNKGSNSEKFAENMKIPFEEI